MHICKYTNPIDTPANLEMMTSPYISPQKKKTFWAPKIFFFTFAAIRVLSLKRSRKKK